MRFKLISSKKFMLWFPKHKKFQNFTLFKCQISFIPLQQPPRSITIIIFSLIKNLNLFPSYCTKNNNELTQYLISKKNLFHFNFDAYKLGKSLHYIRFILALFRMNTIAVLVRNIYTNDRGLPQNYVTTTYTADGEIRSCVFFFCILRGRRNE